MEIRRTYRVKNEEVLHGVKAERNILLTRKQMNGNRIWLHFGQEVPFKTNYGNKYIMEEKGGRRHKRLQDNLQEEIRCRDAKGKALSSFSEELRLEEAMDCQKTDQAVNLQ